MRLSRLYSLTKDFIHDPKNFINRLLRFLRPIRKEYRIWKRMTLYEWLIYHQRHIHLSECRWMGIKAQKNPLDAWVYQEIIYEIKPDIIIEIGSAEGGTTLFLANLLDLIGKGNVISIDIDRSGYKVQHDRVILLTGDSTSTEIIIRVEALCKGKSVLIIHDAGHEKQQVLKDLMAYSCFVSVNSYFIVEDGIVELFKPRDGFGYYKEGPLSAIAEFLRNNPNFIVAKEREKYILTYNPKGFLKRIR